MIRHDDSVSPADRAAGRESRAGFGPQGVVRLPYGGVAIVGAIAILHRSRGALERGAGGSSLALDAIPRPGGARGPEILGNSGRRLTGAGRGTGAVDVGA